MPTILCEILSSARSSPYLRVYHDHILIGVARASLFLPLVRNPSQDPIVFLTYVVVHRLFLWPFIFSPLRSVPGPPLGHPVLGQVMAIVMGDSCIPHREWVKQYGPVVRIVGPFGIERMIFMRPEALHHILVKGWLEYPRVCPFRIRKHGYILNAFETQPRFLRNILGIVTGYGLLTVTGDEHKRMRKAMNPAFSIPNLMSRTLCFLSSLTIA